MSVRHNVPSYFMLLVRDEIKRLDTPWNNATEKAIYIESIRRLLQEYPIEAYSFVSEAWVASVNIRTEPELMDVPPRERSDREDILMVLTRHRDGESYATKYHVEYDTEGKVTLGPAELMEGDFSQGFIGNLFERYTGP